MLCLVCDVYVDTYASITICVENMTVRMAAFAAAAAAVCVCVCVCVCARARACVRVMSYSRMDDKACNIFTACRNGRISYKLHIDKSLSYSKFIMISPTDCGSHKLSTYTIPLSTFVLLSAVLKVVTLLTANVVYHWLKMNEI
jgi:hypothetical protein